MFSYSVDQRLTEWINCRNTIDQIEEPLQYVWDFWHTAPFIPYNKNIDPFFQRGWPSPWEIIVENKYDDFTRALMIAWTLKLTKKFNNRWQHPFQSLMYLYSILMKYSNGIISLNMTN